MYAAQKHVINQSTNYLVDEWAIKYTLPHQNSTSFLFFVFGERFEYMHI